MTQPTEMDRLWAPFRKLVWAEIRAVMGYPGTYEYTINATDGATVDATPTDTTIGLPPLNKVPLRASSIGKLTPPTGKLCHVVFVNAQKTQPRITWCEPEPGDPVARKGDAIDTSLLVAPAGGGPVTGSAIIGGGSDRVNSE